MKTAVVLIDIQNDYFPGGKKELSGSDAAADNAALIISAARKNGMPVIHVRHIAVKPTATFFLPGTEGSEIHSSVTPIIGEKIVIKHFPSSFRKTELEEILDGQKIKQLILCGMMSHMCVDTTTRAAFDLDYTCILAHDACATCDLSFNGQTISASSVQNAFMASLKGTFAQVVSSVEAAAIINSGD
jgi:nicotinamidase-related amidase